jgi:hypothetical protein
MHSSLYQKAKNIFPLLKIMALVSGAIVLLYLPADYFDHGESICPSKVLLDMECLGCGITRAMQHVIHLDFVAAWNFNNLVVIVAPVLFFLWFQAMHKAWKEMKK